MGSRYYDPSAGRFITRDSIGYNGGINLYAYADNNPVNRIDPSGTIDFTIGGFEFDNEGISNGLKTGVAAIGSSLSFGLYNGGRYRSMPGFGASRATANIAREALITAGTMGAGEYISGLRAARAAKSLWRGLQTRRPIAATNNGIGSWTRR